ncbi:hypothetical protein A3J56_01485 [Candidatus Giovannonibacteria bacterium RIFCSPHIGHO2_02_FULL_46_20]|uniref:Uncharacterized protein n=1 Tax=Candidatus Giovannonibacteria bacterium RIFCSPHIGHO2_02_FULL_46_20 TaxID=1798338 RepID=A0A1F5WH31_9BACT|nr:MAG: hypothetical protein A3J56_01485 [Candidatus Giovannonibacteria bacterium RIFCSPHIGHO2_02_FULL_46_20]
MKYAALIQSSAIVYAETAEEAADQVNDALEDARERNCGEIDDEILANAAVVKVKVEKSNDE